MSPTNHAGRKPTGIAIVNYRTPLLVVACLKSLEPVVSDLCGGSVVIVDNASPDDSVAVIQNAIARNGWADWAQVLPQARNGGFAYGNNRAIEWFRQQLPDFGALVLLNPDTEVRPSALRELLAGLDALPNAGIVGPQIEDQNGQLQVSAHPIPSPVLELEGSAKLGLLTRWLRSARSELMPHAQPEVCDWLSGACLVVRRDAIDAIGLMDEGFFLYFEEVDWCTRARSAGWLCWFIPSARIMHVEGASTGINEARKPRPSYWYASRRRFFVKFYGVGGLLAADVLWTIGRVSLLTRRALHLGKGGDSGQSDPTNMFFDLLIGDLRALFNREFAKVQRTSIGESRR